LKKAGINNKIIANIVNERNTTPFEPFVNFEDVMARINGVAAKTMIKMIDSWQR
jgi:predicted nucleic acid-binding OB-fold protein